MMRLLKTLIRDRSGAAAAEMALVTPLLLTLLFGGLEGGNFMLQQHIVTKGVRDGARFAGREPFASYTCSSVSDSNAATAIKNVTATGQVGGTTGGGNTRFAAFTSSTVTINVSCSAGTTTGIYANQSGGAPVVRVNASVPYVSLFGGMILTKGLKLNASAQSAVMGV